MSPRACRSCARAYWRRKMLGFLVYMVLVCVVVVPACMWLLNRLFG